MTTLKKKRDKKQRSDLFGSVRSSSYSYNSWFDVLKSLVTASIILSLNCVFSSSISFLHWIEFQIFFFSKTQKHDDFELIYSLAAQNRCINLEHMSVFIPTVDVRFEDCLHGIWIDLYVHTQKPLRIVTERTHTHAWNANIWKVT